MKSLMFCLTLLGVGASTSSWAYYHCHNEYVEECWTETSYKRHCRKVKDRSDDGYRCDWQEIPVRKRVCRTVPRRFCHDREGCYGNFSDQDNLETLESDTELQE